MERERINGKYRERKRKRRLEGGRESERGKKE